MDIDLLYKKFKSVKNFDDMFQILVEAMNLCKEITINGEQLPEKLRKILNNDILFYTTLKMLSNGDGKQAENFFYKILELSRMPLNLIPKGFFEFHYTLARILYMNKNYLNAAKLFGYSNACRMEVWQDVDELSYFYRANCLAMLGNFEGAANLYEEILQIKSDFPEVRNNLEIVQKNSNENLTLEVSSLWNFCHWQDVPIFINARDRIGVMKKLIDWLLDAGYRNLIILDNASTYQGLMNYYSELEKNSHVKIIKLGKNLGYKALWKSGVLEDLKISTPYIYTDPDVIPIKNCPKDFVRQLYKILDSNHEIRKVGLSLIWEDITISDKETLQKSESDFLEIGYIGDNIAYANVDTTFAIYSNLRNYSLRFSLRTYDKLRCVHLPWYFDYDDLPEDEKYYLEHADRNSITSVKDKVKE